MIELRDIHVQLSERVILDHVSLRVAGGECVGLLGPSGAGKSTLLRIITGEQAPSSGEVKAGDWSPQGTSRRPPAGLFGVVYQDPTASLDWLWRVNQCVEEPLLAQGSASREERRQLVARELANVRLGHIDPDSRVVKLSIGQAQRVALARALVAQPAVILADEPTSALDPTTAATIVRLLADAAGRGAAVVTVSHNAPLLASFCTRILELSNGQLAVWEA